MRMFVARALTGIEALEIADAPAPGALGAGQIRVAMRAASLNYRDLLVLKGMLGPVDANGLIPISDGAGEVIEIAPDVSRVKVGDRVALTHNPDWIGGPFKMSPGARGRGRPGQPGVMQDEMVVNQSETVLLPAHLSFADGAAYPCAGVTAWHALCVPAPLQPGMSVLLQGGGGVSVFALQFAMLFGARVLMTSSSPERCAELKALGADDVIDYRADPDWHKQVRALTNGQGVDLSIDIGGAETIERSMLSTRVGGRVALVGLLTGAPNNASSLFSAGVDVGSIKVGSRDDFEAILRAVGFHKQRPIIAASYPFEKLPDALRHLQSGKQMGKIVIEFAK